MTPRREVDEGTPLRRLVESESQRRQYLFICPTNRARMGNNLKSVSAEI